MNIVINNKIKVFLSGRRVYNMTLCVCICMRARFNLWKKCTVHHYETFTFHESFWISRNPYIKITFIIDVFRLLSWYLKLVFFTTNFLLDTFKDKIEFLLTFFFIFDISFEKKAYRTYKEVLIKHINKRFEQSI